MPELKREPDDENMARIPSIAFQNPVCLYVIYLLPNAFIYLKACVIYSFQYLSRHTISYLYNDTKALMHCD